MVEELELSLLDLRYEDFRLKSRGMEKVLLGSISEYGIRYPLEGVEVERVHILLNGFKRYRCAKKLGIAIVPYRCFGNDEAEGIIELMRISDREKLTILEQARLIEELKTVHKMENWEVAQKLDRSDGWVSMRSGIIHEISDYIMVQIFNGTFPVYSYMYTLRRFIRMKRFSKKMIDEFVESVSGKNLSIREIETLAHGYFSGPEEFREQLRKGAISWGLRHLKDTKNNDCTDLERSMLKELEIIQRYMEKVMYKSEDTRLKSDSFFSQAGILSGGIIGKIADFAKAMEKFHDRCKEAGSNLLLT